MNGSRLRILLAVLLLAVTTAVAAWGWLRPYAWKPDPGARCRIEETQVTRDRIHYWVHLHLRVNPGMEHDLRLPVRLETANGKSLEPADSVFGSISGRRPDELWFKFWLEEADLKGPLELLLNDHRLSVRTGTGIPELGSDAVRNFTTHSW